MAKLLVISIFLLASVHGMIYVDRMHLSFDEKFSNWSILYYHDQKGSVIVNVTFKSYDTVNRALLYVTAKVTKDLTGQDCQIELVNTVIDAGKLLTGSHGNPILKSYLGDVLKTMDFVPKFPLPAGTYRFVNSSINGNILPFEVNGFVDFRIVARFAKSPKVATLVSSFRFVGGFRRG